MVLISVIWFIIGSVNELKNMGRVSEIVKRVDNALARSLKMTAKHPTHENAKDVGYIQNIDIKHLAHIAHKEDFDVFMNTDNRSFVHPQTTLFYQNSRREIRDLLKMIKVLLLITFSCSHAFSSTGNEKSEIAKLNP
jgi:uncharacterized membrane protein